MAETIIIGRGLIGVALVNQAPSPPGALTIIPGRLIAVDIIKGKLPLNIEEKLRSGEGCNVIFSAGLLDPALSTADLVQVNVNLPLAIYEQIDKWGSDCCQFVTFGSVHETIPDMAAQNRYLLSKNLLFSARNEVISRVPWHHLQLHTLYGGEVRSHMFLGQIETALRENKPFHMSAGNQLREYHHVSDIASSTFQFLSQRQTASQCIDFSSGEPISLRTLAKEIFEHFKCQELLHIGTLPPSTTDIFEPSFSRSEHLKYSRKVPESIIEWLETRLSSDRIK